MKKILFILFLLSGLTASSQIFQPPLLYGKEENRLRVKFLMGLPSDTLRPPVVNGVDYKDSVWIASKNGVIYIWNPFATPKKWENIKAIAKAESPLIVDDDSLKLDIVPVSKGGLGFDATPNEVGQLLRTTEVGLQFFTSPFLTRDSIFTSGGYTFHYPLYKPNLTNDVYIDPDAMIFHAIKVGGVTFEAGIPAGDGYIPKWSASLGRAIWVPESGGGGSIAGVASFNGRDGPVELNEADVTPFAVLLSGSYADPDWLTALALSKITGADDLKAIEALAGTSGYAKKTGANTWSLVTAIPNADLANSTISGISLGSNLADFTVGTNLQLSSGTTYNGGTAKTISLQNAAADDATKGAASFNAPYFNSSSGIISPDFTNGLASGSQAGYLSSANWTTFNNKQDALSGTGFVKISGTTISYDNSSYQPLDADLTTIAGLTATTDNFLVSVSSTWASRTPAQVRTTLGLVIGTDVQAYDADLTTWAGLTPPTWAQNLVTTTNPSAIRFIKINADNTTTLEAASTFRTSIGAGTGNGDALVANPLSQFASTTSSQLAGVLNNEVGTGFFVLNDDPDFTTGITSPAYKLSTGGFNLQTGTSYTLLSSDNGKVVTFNSSSAITLTIPSGLTAGFSCTIRQLGTGQITFTASSTTLHNRQSFTKTAGQYALATIIYESSNTYTTGGDMSN